MPEPTERPVDGDERFGGDNIILCLPVGTGDFGDKGGTWPTEAVKCAAGEVGAGAEDPGVPGVAGPFSGIVPAQL